MPTARLVHESTPGFVRAGNAGLRDQRGEVIAFTDAEPSPRDDVWPSASWPCLRILRPGLCERIPVRGRRPHVRQWLG